MSALARRTPAWTITALASLVYLIAELPSPDLAAASYRSDLFSHVGFTVWDNSWYGGHHLPAYSLLAPAFGWLIGPRLLTAISMTVAAALFAPLVAGRFGARATRIATVWFAIGASIGLLSSRVPFDLGLALGLAALVLVQRARFAAALALTLLCSAASPVAGAFLGLAFIAWALAGAERGRARRAPALLGVAALVPIAVLSVVFPEGGTQPFVASAFYPALIGVIAVGLAIPPQQRVLRAGTVLYVLALVGSYVIATAVGGNVDRLGALVAGPVAALVLAVGPVSGWRMRALFVAVPLLLYWQANAPVADFASAIEDPAVNASYYRPLLAELDKLDVGYGRRPARIEVVATADHWEARFVAPAIPIARGWERQLDRYRNGLFYSGPSAPTAASYASWLHAQAISYVALSDAPLDYSAKTEARILDDPGAGLHEIWRSRHWRLFRVLHPTPLTPRPALVTALGTDSFTLQAPAPGTYTVLTHFTPYWKVTAGDGCVARAPGDWTRVRARRAGELKIEIGFSLARIFGRGPRCA